MSVGNVPVFDNPQNNVAPSGVRLFSARTICELALQKVGAFTINDSAAQPEDMQRSLMWLENIIAEVSAMDRCWWLIPATVRFSWPADTRTQIIADALAADYPAQGIIYPISINLLDEDGLLVDELPLKRRWEYESVDDKDLVGTPEIVFLDRLLQDQTISVYPVPDVATWQFDFTFQRYANSVIGDQTNTDQAGERAHGFDASWQRYLVHALAADIGDNPVRRLPRVDTEKWREIAADSLSGLMYFNREKTSEPPRTQRWSY